MPDNLALSVSQSGQKWVCRCCLVQKNQLDHTHVRLIPENKTVGFFANRISGEKESTAETVQAVFLKATNRKHLY
jgi:hypothetical protein